MPTKPLLAVLPALLLPACAVAPGGAGDSSCRGGKCDSLGEFPDGPQFDRFRGFTENVAGIPGILPPNEAFHEVYQDMNQSERRGLAAWHLFAADGKFLREITRTSEGYVNVLELLDSRERRERFERFGTLNDPGCEANQEPGPFGLVLDDCEDPYSSGIIGVRLKPNPDFDQQAWEAIGGPEGHFSDPEETFDVGGAELHGWEVEPPYLPSLTCTVCHAAPNPLEPPDDPANPAWDEVVFALGNQYFKEGAFLGAKVPHDDFSREVLFSQPPGTSDTSRVATDHIFNPNAINAVANLRDRPVVVERASPGYNPDRIRCDAEIPETAGGFLDMLAAGDDPRTQTGECVPTMHVLKDGGDSSGPTGALLRVFVNIGACADQMIAASGGFLEGKGGQRPIDRRELHEACGEYQDLERRAVDTLAYLAYVEPYKLEMAEGFEGCRTPDGRPCLTEDTDLLDRGAMVFAENCATCHSSAQPEDPRFDTRDPSTWFTEERIAFFREQVKQPSFLETNFLSDDRRYPVDLIGTNVARAFATNATEGRIWADYSSETYKDLPPVEGIDVLVPFTDRDFTIPFDAPAGGRGYYRTPSLVNLWSSAPFFHNNGLGDYNGRIDVEGRIAAYEDAAHELLYPEDRDGRATIRRTTRFTWLDTGASLLGLSIKIPLPEGSPIDMFANLGAAIGRGDVDAQTVLGLPTPAAIFENFKEHLAGTDPIQDRGHTFGAELSDEDKRALIEYMKLF